MSEAKDVIKFMHSEHVDELIEMGYGYDIFDGVLLDSFIFYDTENVSIGGMSAKYIIAKETYVNSQSSNYTFIMTDDIDVVHEYITFFESLKCE